MAPCGSEEALQDLLDTRENAFLTAFMHVALLFFLLFLFCYIYKCVRSTSGVAAYARVRLKTSKYIHRKN